MLVTHLPPTGLHPESSRGLRGSKSRVPCGAWAELQRLKHGLRKEQHKPSARRKGFEHRSALCTHTSLAPWTRERFPRQARRQPARMSTGVRCFERVPKLTTGSRSGLGKSVLRRVADAREMLSNSALTSRLERAAAAGPHVLLPDERNAPPCLLRVYRRDGLTRQGCTPAKKPTGCLSP